MIITMKCNWKQVDERSYLQRKGVGCDEVVDVNTAGHKQGDKEMKGRRKRVSRPANTSKQNPAKSSDDSMGPAVNQCTNKSRWPFHKMRGSTYKHYEFNVAGRITSVKTI